MHFLTLIAFACVFWHAEQPGRWRLVPDSDIAWTAILACGLPILWGLLARLASSRALKRSSDRSGDLEQTLRFHHRATTALRSATLAGFAATVFLTRWPAWFRVSNAGGVFQVFGDLAVVGSFLAGLVAVWIGSYPFESSLNKLEEPHPVDGDSGDGRKKWGLKPYLDFHVRHYFLVIAAPMTLILFASNVFRTNEDALRRWSGSFLAPDIGLGLVAACVFVISPLLLKRVWRTSPLPPGEIRSRLESLYAKIDLRFRDILIWHSDGLMINAAVMGVFPQVRYIMLSDALLESMNDRQIEAVFGHEAGHVKHRHMQHLLLFALVGWLLVAGFTEWLMRSSQFFNSGVIVSATVIEGGGLLATVAFWAICFGWMSRRFERQADAFGARCVTPDAANCCYPCSVHQDDTPDVSPDRICSTGAAVFTSALDRVAVLNGIPHEERSWRHSSIGSRIRFLSSLAADPGRAIRFERGIRRTKKIVLLVALLGGLISAGYWAFHPSRARKEADQGVAALLRHHETELPCATALEQCVDSTKLAGQLAGLRVTLLESSGTPNNSGVTNRWQL